jgi:hypothetical protein
MAFRLPFVCLAVSGLALVAGLDGVPLRAQGGQAATPKATASPSPSTAAGAPLTDLDAFMARVLKRRDETWRTLHDYILSETETFGIDGPANLPINGFKREYTWYVRDGFLVRSPVKYDGVALSDADRRAYETKWLEQEKAREKRSQQKAKAAGSANAPAVADASAVAAPTSLDDLVSGRGEPRFISEAYFLQFKFEPGNYYLVGRESIGDRPVVKIEYYPTRLFGTGSRTSGRRRPGREPQPVRTPPSRTGRRSRATSMIRKSNAR